VGVGALVAVWFCRPLWPDTPQRRLQRDLEAARHLLSRSDGDAEEALRLAHRARETAGQLTERVGEAELLLGTAHLRLAERAPPERAGEQWASARRHLEQAEHEGVPEESRPQLAYRLGKVGLQTNDDLGRVTRRLADNVAVDNPAEGYGLLTQAYLRRQPPDLERALEANRKQRDAHGISPEELASAQLLGGELLLRLGKPEEARRTLARIGDQAPAVLARAQLLQARSYQDEKNWAEAIRLYELARGEQRAPLPEPAKVLYNLGLCYREHGLPAEAVRAWGACVKQSPGDEGQAAALGLAELLLAEPTLEEALKALTQAVASVRNPAAWANPLADLNRARTAFEAAAAAFRQAARFDLALQLTVPYERVAAPGRALLLRGQVAAEHARQHLESAAQAAAPEGRQEHRKAAADLFRRSAAAYAEAAALPGLPAGERAEHLWHSAEGSIACEDHARGAEALRQFLKLDPKSPLQAEGWYRLGEACRSLGNTPEALNAHRQALSYPAPHNHFGYLARYQLALLALAAGDPDEAEAALVLNLKLLRFDSDREAHEKTLFALGGLLYQRHNYREVVRYLEEALGRFKDNPESTLGRYRLADSYRQIAAQENQSFLLGERMTDEARQHFQREHRRWLEKAAREFAALDKFLQGPEGKGHLTPEQRTQVPFIAAKCYFNLGKYHEALEVYNELMVRHQDKVEGLDALGAAVTCHAALGQVNMVKQRLLEIRKALPAFEEAVRLPWEKWLNEAIKNLEPLEPASRP
jgi:tetratricopeptide (TPR) repeat protein